MKYLVMIVGEAIIIMANGMNYIVIFIGEIIRVAKDYHKWMYSYDISDGVRYSCWAACLLVNIIAMCILMSIGSDLWLPLYIIVFPLSMLQGRIIAIPINSLAKNVKQYLDDVPEWIEE